MRIALVFPTMLLPHSLECINTWRNMGSTNLDVVMVDNSVTNRGVLPSLQFGYQHSTAELVAFLHDDTVCREAGWDERVLAEFSDPQVGLVGFGGALAHGSADLYKVKYGYHQLGRSGYLSNVDDAEVHGQRFAGTYDVAVLDGFALIARREFLDKLAWPVGTPVGYSLYDYWLCCEAHRQGYRIRLIGIRCHHLGGRTAVVLGLAGDGTEHQAAHRWLYDHYQDVLPWSVK